MGITNGLAALVLYPSNSHSTVVESMWLSNHHRITSPVVACFIQCIDASGFTITPIIVGSE